MSKNGTYNKKTVSIYFFLLPIVLLGLSMFAALLVSSRDGERMLRQYVPLQDATMLVRHELTLFHLSVEKHLIQYDKAAMDWRSLDHAQWISHAIISGGRDGENIYIPVDDPLFVKKADELDKELARVRMLAQGMAARKHDKESVRALEPAFDDALDSSAKKAGELEDVLHGIIDGQLAEYSFMTKSQMVSCIIFTILAGAAIAWFGRKQSVTIAELEASRELLKWNEQKLSAALSRLRLLSEAVEAAPDLIQITDMEGRVLYSNKALMQLYGYTPEEFNGRHVDEMNVDHGFAGKVILPAIKKTGSWTGELHVKKKSGEVFPVWLTTSLVKDESGTPMAMVGVVRDITEKKRAEDELKKFKFILDKAGEEFYMIEPTGSYAYMNEAAIKALGYTGSELHGMKIGDINPMMDEKTWQDHFKMHKAGSIPPFEIVHVTKDGRRVSKEVTAAYMAAGGKEYICSFVRDITERKNIEQFRSDFYAMITHDLKSPLTTILSCSYMLLESAQLANEDDRSLVNAIKNSGEKMATLIEDFISYEKAESGRLVASLMPEDIASLLAEIGSGFDTITKQKGLSFKTELHPGIPRVLLDRKLAERAVRNLISNAVAYTPMGGTVSVSAGMVSRRGDGGFLEISVSDTGPGIPKSELDRIFNKYYRSPKTAGIRGAGLGLAIVKTVAEAHGGRVEVESEPGKGSVFRLLFPVKS